MSFPDLAGIGVFLLCYLGYHALYLLLPRAGHVRTRESVVEGYRRAWFLNIERRNEPILVIQTMRNLIMVHSFLGSISILAVGGLFSYFFTNIDLLQILEQEGLMPFLDQHGILVKLLAAQMVLLFSFLNSIYGLRVCFNLNFTLSAPKDLGGKLDFQMESLNRQARHMILSVRSLYFTAPLLLWVLSPWLLLGTSVMVALLLARFDFLHGHPTRQAVELPPPTASSAPLPRPTALNA